MRHSIPDNYDNTLTPRAYALADMVASPGVAKYVARAARLPASKIGIMGPAWMDLQRVQAWATGPKRGSQIIIENDPYHITLDVPAALGTVTPVIDVNTQAPSTATAARLATAVGGALSAYVIHLQTASGVPKPDRYDVSPARARVGCSRAHLAACQRRRLHLRRRIRALVRGRDRCLELDERSPRHGGRLESCGRP